MTTRFLSLFALSSIAAKAADEPPLFIGVMTIGKEQRIVLTSKTSGRSSGWITIGGTFESYRVTDYDPKTESVGLERDKKKTRAHIVDASTSTLPDPGT